MAIWKKMHNFDLIKQLSAEVVILTRIYKIRPKVVDFFHIFGPVWSFMLCSLLHDCGFRISVVYINEMQKYYLSYKLRHNCHSFHRYEFQYQKPGLNTIYWHHHCQEKCIHYRHLSYREMEKHKAFPLLDHLWQYIPHLMIKWRCADQFFDILVCS